MLKTVILIFKNATSRAATYFKYLLKALFVSTSLVSE